MIISNFNIFSLFDLSLICVFFEILKTKIYIMHKKLIIISAVGSPTERKISFAVQAERSDSIHSSNTSLSVIEGTEEKKGKTYLSSILSLKGLTFQNWTCMFLVIHLSYTQLTASWIIFTWVKSPEVKGTPSWLVMLSLSLSLLLI